MPSELSGGEQQRIAIARALLNNPVIIIADEPTGNLDPETATNIVGILKRASEEGTTVIMSTHNINLLNQFPGKVYQCKNEEFRIVNDTKDTNDPNDEKIEIIADPLDFQDEEDATRQS